MTFLFGLVVVGYIVLILRVLFPLSARNSCPAFFLGAGGLVAGLVIGSRIARAHFGSALDTGFDYGGGFLITATGGLFAAPLGFWLGNALNDEFIRRRELGKPNGSLRDR